MGYIWNLFNYFRMITNTALFEKILDKQKTAAKSWMKDYHSPLQGQLAALPFHSSKSRT